MPSAGSLGKTNICSGPRLPKALLNVTLKGLKQWPRGVSLVYSGVKDLVAITCDVGCEQFDLIVSSIGLVSRRLGLDLLGGDEPRY